METFEESNFALEEQGPWSEDEAEGFWAETEAGAEVEDFDESMSVEQEAEDEGRSPHPSLRRGSFGPDVMRAQTLLNQFLRRIVRRPQECVDRSPARVAEMRGLLVALRRSNQLPLTVDGKFGPNTDSATKLFQSCRGLVRDGVIGNVTWAYLGRGTGQRRHRNLPDTTSCGVPDRPSAEFEAELDRELEMLGETQRRAAPAVRPALSLFLNASKTSDRNHFECQASRIARIIGAYANPRPGQCVPRRVGPTAFDTGADIVNAITAAHSCLKRPIAKLQIVGHSGSYGVFGSTLLTDGIYRMVDAADRATGARAVTDVPASALANDVVVVLHGCSQGAGSDSFAERLYRHLATTLTAPVVFAHTNNGCAGRDNSWRRFDARTPAGRGVSSIAPHYSGDGCCAPARRHEAEAPQLEVGSEWEAEGAVGGNEWAAAESWEPVQAGGSHVAARKPCGCRN